MHDFMVYSNSFDECMSNLTKILERFLEFNLILNCEKCYFMVKKGIILGHKISKREIEVDKAKVDIIERLPAPMNMK